MNIILIMSDTFRRDALSCYGTTPAQTPRLGQFAQESFVFDNAFCGSFPTIPNRLDIMSGRFTFIDHEWCRLPPDTVTVQQILSASGFTTMLIADNAHMIEDGYNYCRGFNGWEWIRGQESDLWYTSPKNVQLPSGGAKKNRGAKIRLPNIIRNSSWWQGEEDRHAPRTIKTACRWLELNQGKTISSSGSTSSTRMNPGTRHIITSTSTKKSTTAKKSLIPATISGKTL